MREPNVVRISVALFGALVLSACLVGKDKTKNYTISLPSTLPTYANGHYIHFGYELYLLTNNGVVSQSSQGGMTMTWTLSSLNLPFGLGLRTPVLLHQITESPAIDSERISAQYITQDSDGSIFLNAFKGVTAANSYWPDVDGVLSTPDEPETKKAFTSPIDDGTTSLVGVSQHASQAMDYYVMGSTCSSSAGSGNCAPVARFTYSDFTIEGIDNLTTPLGNIEAYRLHYSGTMTPMAVISESSYFDYRVSCGTPGSLNPVTFEGNVWIYPPIGPVKLQNLCGSSPRFVNFVAQIIGTNLPH